jgi:hypothetical protein
LLAHLAGKILQLADDQRQHRALRRVILHLNYLLLPSAQPLP